MEAERTDELSECRVALLRRMALSSLLHRGRAPCTGVARAAEGSLQTFDESDGKSLYIYIEMYTADICEYLYM